MDKINKDAGRIDWQGEDLVPAGPARMRAIRSKEIGFIFQEPMTSLRICT